MSIKVRMHFVLTGKTTEWKQYIKHGDNIAWSNADTLDYVKGLVSKQFGSRPLFIVNEGGLVNDQNPYPPYFTAGWFVSDGGECKELVVLSHADSMDRANKLLMHHIRTVDWEHLAKDIK